MLTREDDVDAHALHRRGWTISAIARHLGHDRKTVRAYLSGGRVAGQRRRAEPDPFEPFAGYCRERLGEDPHLWATTLFDELLELGYDAPIPRSPASCGPAVCARPVNPAARPATGRWR
jgi:transposase